MTRHVRHPELVHRPRAARGTQSCAVAACCAALARSACSAHRAPPRPSSPARCSRTLRSRPARASSRQELRCLVCQNQSIDDSNAELARDLRLLVRERLAAGDSDAAVLAFVEARYGEFVLLRPPLKPHTLLLWAAPLLLLLGIGRSTSSARQRACRAAQVPVGAAVAAERQRLDEQQRRDALLKRLPA